MKSKFHILKPIIDEIGITSKISQYYARWLEQSKITQLTQKDLLNNHFLLLSFVKYQYFIRNDNIIDRFISIIQSTKSSILRHQKDLYFLQLLLIHLHLIVIFSILQHPLLNIFLLYHEFL